MSVDLWESENTSPGEKDLVPELSPCNSQAASPLYASSVSVSTDLLSLQALPGLTCQYCLTGRQSKNVWRRRLPGISYPRGSWAIPKNISMEMSTPAVGGKLSWTQGGLEKEEVLRPEVAGRWVGVSV